MEVQFRQKARIADETMPAEQRKQVDRVVEELGQKHAAGLALPLCAGLDRGKTVAHGGKAFQNR